MFSCRWYTATYPPPQKKIQLTWLRSPHTAGSSFSLNLICMLICMLQPLAPLCHWAPLFTIAFIPKQPLFKVPGLHSSKFKGSSREACFHSAFPVLFPDDYFVVFSLFIWSHLNQSLWAGKWSTGLDCLRTGQGRCRHNLHCWNCIERKQRKVPVSLPADSRQDCLLSAFGGR